MRQKCKQEKRERNGNCKGAIRKISNAERDKIENRGRKEKRKGFQLIFCLHTLFCFNEGYPF